MTTDAVFITLTDSVAAAAMLTVVYFTGQRFPQFHWRRWPLVFAGFALVTVPVPLIVLWVPEDSQQAVAIIGSLYVLAIVVVFFTVPKRPNGKRTPDTLVFS